VGWTYKLPCTQPPYLYLYSASSWSQHTLFTLRHSDQTSSSLRVTHRSFRHASPQLWNRLPTSLRIPHPNHSSSSQRPSFEHAGLTCYTLLSPYITFSLFHSELKTYLIRKSYGFICSSVFMFQLYFFLLFCFTSSRLNWQALWSTFGRK